MRYAARMGSRIAAVLLGLTAASATAGPIVSVGAYDVTLSKGHQYKVSGEVFQVSNTYLYEYTVQNLSKHKSRFELGLASNTFFWGNYTETSPQVSPGTGVLLHDLSPDKKTILPSLGEYNYVFTHLKGKKKKSRDGISIGPGETVTLSFYDTHAPSLQDWWLEQIHPKNKPSKHQSTIPNAGGLPVPAAGGVTIAAAPEPSALVLAGLGAVGMGLSALRRRRKLSANP